MNLVQHTQSMPQDFFKKESMGLPFLIDTKQKDEVFKELKKDIYVENDDKVDIDFDDG